MTRLFVSALVACGLLGTATLAKAEDPIVLKMSHFLPSSHPSQTDFLEPWAKELEARAKGRVKVEIYSAGSAFGNVANQLDQVKAGVIDIAHGLSGIPRGRLPRTLIMDMPFLVKTADAASKTLWDLYADGDIAPEYEGLKVLALHAHNAGLIHTRDKPVSTMEDLAGLRLRTPSQAVSMMLEQLGATPVGMPPTEVYAALQKGVIDGNAFTYEAVHSFKLHEVLKHHLDAKAYTTTFFFVMNKRKYDSLPEDIRAVIDDMSGAPLVAKFGGWWTKWDEAGKTDIIAAGNTVTPLSDAERAKWREALAPMIDAYLTVAEEQGAENARAIYVKAQKLVEKYEGAGN
ncbi:MAG: TRAP transporter substrate-binding protein [Rhodospirillum sp.]|nr:TRAP transporter substrate-binding protein [Rhodospirillum sp.]MCF8491258.1 TRAP transporter substrate-binding protein [Rhodospirillum sp.]MCF8500766.1 TRAP transporter substrate-binding protein [Rhodospirillum sp.]